MSQAKFISACIVALIANVAAFSKDNTSVSTTLPEGPGKRLVIQYCKQCHELKRIEEDQGTEAEWITRIRRMTRRGATIPVEQIEPLGKYLAQALPPRVRSRAGDSSPIATAVAEVAIRPIQTWVRGAGKLQSDLVTIVATLNAADAAHVQIGNRARAFALSSRSSMFQARVIAVTKGVKEPQARIQLSRPGPAAGEIYLIEVVTEQAPMLSIPNEAIIEEGERQIVYVQRPSGDYVSRDIKTGLQGELHSQVLSGLQSGEQVVTFGSFFIDAEYKLKTSSAMTITAKESLDIAYKGLPDPLREGDNAIEVVVMQTNGAPLTDGVVIVTYSMAAMPSMNMPEMRDAFTLTHQGEGKYSGHVRLSMAGTWQVSVAVTHAGKTLGKKEFMLIAK